MLHAPGTWHFSTWNDVQKCRSAGVHTASNACVCSGNDGVERKQQGRRQACVHSARVKRCSACQHPKCMNAAFSASNSCRAATLATCARVGLGVHVALSQQRSALKVRPLNVRDVPRLASWECKTGVHPRCAQHQHKNHRNSCKGAWGCTAGRVGGTGCVCGVRTGYRGSVRIQWHPCNCDPCIQQAFTG